MTAAIAAPIDIARLESQPYESYQPHRSVLEALEHAARDWPGRTALTYIESPDPELPARRWSYAEFATEVRRAANLFRQLSGGKPARVATLLPNIPQAWSGDHGRVAVFAGLRRILADLPAGPALELK